MQALPALLLLFVSLFALPSSAATPEVPEPLRPWTGWVLHGTEERDCPLVSGQDGERRCAWPGELQIAADAEGARFAQSWELYAEGVVALPGGSGLWPQAVEVNGEPAVVTLEQGRPAVRLAAGSHRVSGRIPWTHLPEALPVPPSTALVALSVAGEPVQEPELDRAGRLWLRAQAQAERAPEERLEMRVFRRVVDELPARLVTRIELDVSGGAREQVLGTALPPGFLPLQLDSALPARLEPDGGLRVQVRPGRWTLVLTGRHAGPLERMQAPAQAAGPWPRQEVWVFDARPYLRLVDLEGLVPVDPRQTDLPGDWRALPAFLVSPGDTLTLVERRRGSPESAPDRLQLERRLWLDFNGGGYTVADRMTGTVSRSWRLEAAPPLALGRVAVDGDPRFITRLEEGNSGVEVRPGPLDLSAVARIEGRPDALPAVGWQHDVESLSASLELPPGWRLVSAAGPDRVSNTWLQQWTLLDLFLVLIVALASARLAGPLWGAVALVTLVLTYQEPGAPQWVWLFLLAAVAVLRLLPEGGLRRFALLLRNAAILALALVTVPFLVEQVRLGLYPALEAHGPAPVALERREAEPPGVRSMPAPSARAPMEALEDKAGEYGFYPPRPQPPRYDPDTQIQTGPGLPDWQWQRVSFGWNGPVEQGRELALWLLPPAVNQTLAFLRAALVLLLAAGLIGLRYTRGGGWRLRGAAALLATGLLLPLALLPPPVQAQEHGPFPPPALLEQLRERLLEPPACLPECALSPQLSLAVAHGRLRVEQTVHAGAPVAVPLPARAGQWLPERVSDNGEAVTALYRDEGGLIWVRLAAGVHRLTLEGALPTRDSLQLPLPLVPQRVSAEAQGWQVVGMNADGTADGQLELRRLERQASEQPAALEPGSLPPFLRVERHLDLGLTWSARTRVVREGPVGQGIVMEVPLLPGESVTSPGVQVSAGRVRVNLGPQQRQMQWESVIAPTAQLLLAAPEVDSWVELWRVQVSPLWHVSFDGPPPVRPPGEAIYPVTWRPWPGERLMLELVRPAGVPGPTLTVERSALTVVPGGSNTRIELDLTLRSSGAARHRIPLPADARVQSLQIGGVEQPTPVDAEALLLPLNAGEQQVRAVLQVPDRMGARYHPPLLHPAASGANLQVTLTPPSDRWLLYLDGPRLGPAVLFWGVLLVVAALALGLGRWRVTPLGPVQWFLLGIGLSQVAIEAAAVVVGWLLALAWRCRKDGELKPGWHNLVQVVLVLFTLVALATLYQAVAQGLLGRPEMQIAGNDSSAWTLNWYADRIGAELPEIWVLSLPMWFYRLLMLAWALWLANALIGWLRWGWSCFSRGGLWRKVDLRLPRAGKREA